jgi:hypothetical protein
MTGIGIVMATRAMIDTTAHHAMKNQTGAIGHATTTAIVETDPATTATTTCSTRDETHDAIHDTTIAGAAAER